MSDPNILLMQIRVLEEEIAEKDRRIEELEATLRVCRDAANSLNVYDAAREVIGDE